MATLTYTDDGSTQVFDIVSSSPVAEAPVEESTEAPVEEAVESAPEAA